MVYLNDVAEAVVQAARGEIEARVIADLTEHQVRSLQEVTRMVRVWQGYGEWRLSLTMPKLFVRAVGRLADAVGWLGWRSPLRTTAVRTLEGGVTGDPLPWERAGGVPCRSLEATLAAMPATIQERLFARIYLLLPIGIATLSLFWFVSGLIGIASRDVAQAVLTDRGFTEPFAALSVIGGSVIDMGLGLAILVRPWARRAAIGIIAVSLGYLFAGTIWTPDLWADPLGPFMKVTLGIALALMVAGMLEER